MNLCTYPAIRGTSKHPQVTEIAKGTHPLGALARLFLYLFENWRFSKSEISATQYFIDVKERLQYMIGAFSLELLITFEYKLRLS